MEYHLVLYLLTLLGCGLLYFQARGSLACLEEERVGLLKLKEAFHLPNVSDSLPSWGVEEIDCCRWEMVTCDSMTKRVIRLSLSQARVELGFLDAPFFNGSSLFLNASLFLPFQELQNLSLDGNRLKGFHGELRSSKLQILDLSWNMFTEIPSLGALQSLKVLNLEGNSLESFSHFQELTRLSNLEVLDLGYNYLIGEIPPWIGALTSLKTLSFTRNQLNGSLPMEGFHGELRLSKLQVLDLSWNWFTEIPSLGALQSLKVLNLEANILNSFSHFQEFTSLGNLEVLNLGFNHLIGEIPPSIGALTSLKTLSFWKNQLNGSLEELTRLGNLEVLNLGYNYLIGEIPPSIGAMTSLKVLSFRSNQLNGSLPMEGFCKLRNLQELDLSGNSFEGNLSSCLGNLASLRLLELSENNFGGTIPSTLFPSLKSLEYVSLSYNHFEGSFSFSSLANSSKLEFFKLENHNNNLKVETENLPWTPLFQLKIFRLSNCKLNEATGAIPSFLLHQYDLREVILSHNNMVGRIPTWLLLNNTRLEVFSLANNLLSGPLVLNADSKNVFMLWFDVSMNRFQGEVPFFIGPVLPNLKGLNMSKNGFQGSIPPSLGDMTSLEFLDLSDNNFSGQLPEHLVMGCVSLTILKLSSNNLQGQLLPAKSNLARLVALFLDNNRFLGEISIGLSNSTNLKYLDLSNNSLSGQIFDWIGIFHSLSSLILSKNSLVGSLPKSFCNLRQLRFLDLSNNSFIGAMPSCVNLASLRYLHLQGNEFNGPIPNVLSIASSLVTLDLRDNKFSGRIPSWISLLSNLRVLLLKGNTLEGPIPFQLCQLINITLIDFSHNNLSGSIPSCLQIIPNGTSAFDYSFIGNIQMWQFQSSTYLYESQLTVSSFIEIEYYLSDEVEEVKFITKSRSESYKGNILYLFSGIDLSWNKFIGSIPPEIGNLSGLITLNLSHNHLTGSIPKTFSNLKKIESLDLSQNRLGGEIPSELIDLNFLSVFTVAYNNLSGRTPDRKKQFATFEENSYEGNPLLCGLPLPRSCTTISAIPSAQSPSRSRQRDLFNVDFFWSFGGAYFVAFICVVSFLYLSSYHRGLLFEPIEARIVSYL